MRRILFLKGIGKAKLSIPVTPTVRKLLGSKAESQTLDRPDTFWMVQPSNYERMAHSEIGDSGNLKGHLTGVGLVPLMPYFLYCRSVAQTSF